MKYFSADNPPPRGLTNPGSPFQKEYKLDLDRNEVVEVGEVNLQELIDSAENSCRLDKILERYQVGDLSGGFPQYDGVVDMTRMPRNLSDAFELVDTARQVYNEMSTEQQNVFGSFAGFCRAIDNGDYFTAEQKPAEAPATEVNEDGKQ